MLYPPRLFRQHPEYKDFFKDLIDPNAQEEDGWLNPRFERHMIHVLLPTLGSIIRNVDRPEAIREQMIRLGKVHKVKDIGLKRKHVEVGTLSNSLLKFIYVTCFSSQHFYFCLLKSLSLFYSSWLFFFNPHKLHKRYTKTWKVRQEYGCERLQNKILGLSIVGIIRLHSS